MEESRIVLEKAEDLFGINIDPDTSKDTLKREEDKIGNQIRRFKAEQKELEEKLNDELDRIKHEKATLEEKKKRGQLDLKEAKHEVAKLKLGLCDLEGAGDFLQQIQQEWENKKGELEEARGRVDLDRLQASVKEMKTEVQQQEGREEQLKAELTALEEKQTTVQEIEYINNDIQAKTEKRQKIAAKRNSVLLDIFQTVPDFSRLKNAFKTEQERIDNLVKDQEKEKQTIENSIIFKNTTKVQLKKDIAKRVLKENAYQGKMSDVLVDGEDLETETQRSKERLELATKELQVREAGKFTYREFLDSMERMEKPACPTCQRGFHNKSEFGDLKRDLEAMIAEIPTNVEKLAKKVQAEEANYNNLQRLLPDYYAWKLVKQEISELSKQLAAVEEDVKTLSKEKQEKEETWFRTVEERDKLNIISEDVQLIDNLSRELGVLEEKKEDLQLLCPALEEGRGLEVVRREEKQVSSDLKQARKECERMQDEYNIHCKLLNELEATCNRLTNKKLEIESKQQQRANMVEKKADLEKRVCSIQQEIETAKEELEPLKANLEAKESEKSKFKRTKEQELENLQAKERKLESIQRDLQKLENSIAEYKNGNKAEKLMEARNRKTELDREVEKHKEEKSRVEEELSNLNREIASQDSMKRNLTDNLKLRKLSEDENCQQVEIDKYREKLANTDFIRVEEKKNSLLRKMNNLNAEVNSKSGKISEMKRTVKEVELELENPKLKMAAR